MGRQRVWPQSGKREQGCINGAEQCRRQADDWITLGKWAEAHGMTEQKEVPWVWLSEQAHMWLSVPYCSQPLLSQAEQWSKGRAWSLQMKRLPRWNHWTIIHERGFFFRQGFTTPDWTGTHCVGQASFKLRVPSTCWYYRCMPPYPAYEDSCNNPGGRPARARARAHVCVRVCVHACVCTILFPSDNLYWTAKLGHQELHLW